MNAQAEVIDLVSRARIAIDDQARQAAEWAANRKEQRAHERAHARRLAKIADATEAISAHLVAIDKRLERIENTPPMEGMTREEAAQLVADLVGEREEKPDGGGRCMLCGLPTNGAVCIAHQGLLDGVA